MEKINNVVKSPIAPKTTNAIWINTEDNTINVFDEHQGWIQVSGGSEIKVLEDAVQKIQESMYKGIPVTEHSSSSTTISPNEWNVWTSPVSNLTITKGTDTEDIVNEYMIKFTVDSSATTPQIVFSGWSLTWAEGDVPTWTAGNTYEISIVDDIAVFKELEPAS